MNPILNPILNPLILDLVEWVAEQPRAYEEVLDAWRTSCPRLTIWEDTVDQGYVAHQRSPGQSTMIVATQSGLGFLRENDRLEQDRPPQSRSDRVIRRSALGA